MAKKEESAKVVLGRTYVIPLRRETLKVPPFRKANKAIKTIQIFISKHMKSDNVVIGKYLNLGIWKHGARSPPGKIKVNVTKDDKGRVVAEIFGAPKETPKVEEKKAKKEEPKIEKAEEKVEEMKEEKTEEARKIEKEEIKELQKEHPKRHAPKVPPKQKIQDQRPPAPKSV